MQKKARILFAAAVLSLAALTSTSFFLLGNQERVTASSDCYKEYGTVMVECVGTDGACILYGAGLDKVCPGSAYATEISQPVP